MLILGTENITETFTKKRQFEILVKGEVRSASYEGVWQNNKMFNKGIGNFVFIVKT